jgi:hypothetical protein
LWIAEIILLQRGFEKCDFVTRITTSLKPGGRRSASSKRYLCKAVNRNKVNKKIAVQSPGGSASVALTA